MNHLISANMPPHYGEITLWSATLAVLFVLSVCAILGVSSLSRDELRRRGISRSPRAVRRRVLVLGAAIGVALCLSPNLLLWWEPQRGFPLPLDPRDPSGTVLGVVLPIVINVVCGVGVASLAAVAWIVGNGVRQRSRVRRREASDRRAPRPGASRPSKRRQRARTSRRHVVSSAQPN